jgi:hypothetical protein
MFLGHFALGFAAKPLQQGMVSLGTLFFACQFADLLWPVLVLTGVERVSVDPGNTAFTPLNFEFYPYSHSLVMLLLWGGFVGFVYVAFRHVAGAVSLLGGLVASHWFLDLVVHRPDLPLAPWIDVLHGHGLWNSVPGTLIAELGMFAVGIGIYVRATQPRDRRGTIALWSLVGVFVAVYLAAAFGPPPPSSTAVAVTALLMWLFVGWGYYIDRHREPVARRAPRARPSSSMTS